MTDAQDLPRERFLKLGENALTDAEILAVLLRTGTEGIPVMELAHNLLAQFDDNLLKLGDAGINELQNIKGIGLAKAVGLAAAFALGRRIAHLRLQNAPNANSPELIAEYIRAVQKNPDQEEFHVLMLDVNLQLIQDKVVTIGLIDRSLVHAREVFRDAISASCSHIVIAHTHPSGSVRPSHEDIELTRSLVKAGNIIGIPVLDHVIVAARIKADKHPFFSFRAAGMLPE